MKKFQENLDKAITVTIWALAACSVVVVAGFGYAALTIIL